MECSRSIFRVFRASGQRITLLMRWTTTSPRCNASFAGKERPVLDRLQAKIKGVPGGQTSGTALISANAAAFESYGLRGSLIAPTCADCGEKFTLALNELLVKESAHKVLGGSVMIFWTRNEVEFDLFGPITEPTPRTSSRTDRCSQAPSRRAARCRRDGLLCGDPLKQRRSNGRARLD